MFAPTAGMCACQIQEPILKLMTLCGQADSNMSDPANPNLEWMQSSGLDNRQAHMKSDEEKVRIEMHAFVKKRECIVCLGRTILMAERESTLARFAMTLRDLHAPATHLVYRR